MFVPIPIDGKQGGNFEMDVLKATLVEYESEKIGGHLKDLNEGAPQLRKWRIIAADAFSAHLPPQVFKLYWKRWCVLINYPCCTC